MDNQENKNPESLQRVIAFLNRQQEDFIDKVGKDALFSKGTKLSRSKIISALVDLMMELSISGKDVSSLEEFKQRIREKIHPIYLYFKDSSGDMEPTAKEIPPDLLEK